MSPKQGDTGDVAMFEPDYEVLISFLEKNYDVKSAWRKEYGLTAKA